jgi:transposase-like protein
VGEDRSFPAAGIDYPGTWREFLAWFPDDAACLAFLEHLRWPKGFVCPKCSGTQAWEIARHRWMCARCGRKTSVTAGTIFDKTRTPLPTWFAAVWYVTSQKHGVSALGLKRALGLGSYETAWTMMHKLRRAMVRPDRDRLSGVVEVDETFVGGVEPGVDGRETHTKTLVAIAAEENGRGIGRIRLARIANASADSLSPFIVEMVERGSTVHTDGWHGYVRMAELGYQHKVTRMLGSGKKAHELMPRVHRVASLLKRWLLGTHQGAVSPEHLDYYLDEFTFRFNRRNSTRRGLLFYRLLEQAVETAPAPYKHIVGGAVDPQIARLDPKHNI